MPELDEFEQAQADVIAELAIAQGVDPETARATAKVLILQAAAAGMAAGLAEEAPDA